MRGLGITSWIFILVVSYAVVDVRKSGSSFGEYFSEMRLQGKRSAELRRVEEVRSRIASEEAYCNAVMLDGELYRELLLERENVKRYTEDLKSRIEELENKSVRSVLNAEMVRDRFNGLMGVGK